MKIRLKKYVAPPEQIARLRTLCLVMAGALTVMLLQAFNNLFLLVVAPQGRQVKLEYALTGVMIVTLSLALIICYRCARYSKLPGTAAILAMMGMMAVMVALGRMI